MPVNQTVKPLEAIVPRFMDPESPSKSRRRIPTFPHSGKEYAGTIPQFRGHSRKVRNRWYFLSVEIPVGCIPTIQASAVNPSGADGNDEIAHARPERLVSAPQGYVL